MEFFLNHPILSLAWIACFVAIIVTYIQDRLSGINVIGNNMVGILINSQKGVVVDLRSLNDFRNGHITGAVHLLPTDIKTNNVGKIESYKDKPVILVNQDGLNLLDSGKSLTKQGFTKVYILKDGIAGWLTDNLILVKK
ncbi:rhodanese-like domain-containing protein [Psittacicella gerlachiana]|uniref:Rhodanese domain-containing protein n=1 Tax=Psittacicella gerlachiana TaxID=2028574 RepID=A0A3A1Y4A4_9GAMM|nr:rhodanese-like domain-containing protein [Psittacicella gerlachiana]RIY32086.1 hypothetical protein CKF59_07200 [Psittacicella gerlachiana]